MKRGIATITVYVYGDNDQELMNDAKNICRTINAHQDTRAGVEKLHNAPFGSYGDEITEIDITKLNHV